jgi:uncharacterized protein (DUF433 family)
MDHAVIQPSIANDRIVAVAGVCGGRPCVRDTRIRVTDIVEMKALGVADADILDDFPELEAADIAACLHHAAKLADKPSVLE